MTSPLLTSTVVAVLHAQPGLALGLAAGTILTLVVIVGWWFISGDEEDDEPSSTPASSSSSAPSTPARPQRPQAAPPPRPRPTPQPPTVDAHGRTPRDKVIEVVAGHEGAAAEVLSVWLKNRSPENTALPQAPATPAQPERKRPRL